MALERHIGFVGLTFIAVGAVIGSGWIFGPLLTAQLAGPASIISWCLGGLGMLVLALCFAEISSIIPVAGGIARLPMFSHGKLTAMIMGWTAWIGYNTAAPIETIASLNYLAAYFPWIKEAGAKQNELSVAGLFAASGILVIFTLLNALGVKAFTRANTLITWAKVFIPVVVAVALLTLSFHPENFTAYDGFMPFGWHGVFSAVSTGGIIFSFIGFRHAIDMAGETKRPQLIIPLALVCSLLLCLGIYVILQIAFIGSLDAEQLAKGWDDIEFKGNLGPLAGVIVGLGVGWLTVVLYAGAVLGPLGAGLIPTGSNGRLVYAMAVNDTFPAYFGKLSKYRVPLRAMLLNLVIGFLIIFFIPFNQAVALNSASIILSFSVGPIAVYTFRRQFPDRKRKFRMPMVQLMAIIGLAVSSLVIYWSGWHIFKVMAASIVVGIIVYAIHLKQCGESWSEVDYRSAFWLLPYLAGMGLIGYCGHYGGGLGLIDFPVDFVLVVVLSIVIFYLAVHFSLPQSRAQEYLDASRLRKEESHKLIVYPEVTPLIVPSDEKDD